ncbi:MAG: hypothetical protein HUJ66_06500 [Oscillospiraceae bacterium]|nr:hypothetical protein [Oscillospiraceae bacterium]
MNSIVFICPYFGKLGGSFPLWLESCAANSDIDFLILTDDERVTETELPENVRAVPMSWEDCKALVRSRLGMEVNFAYSYKLCDIKPAYGEVFSDYIEGYDFWGHTDLTDTVMGNLRSFITDEMLCKYDKLHAYGHMTLYRNTAENNARYRIMPRCGTRLEDLFSKEEVTGFDEMWHEHSINTIFKENGFPLIDEIENLVADILPAQWRFRLYQDHGEYIPRVFEWKAGQLFELTVRDGEVCRREIGYVHFQKRKISIAENINTGHFYFVPNEFISAEEPMTAERIREYSADRLYLDPLRGRLKRLAWYAKHPKAFMRKVKEKL